MIMLQLYKRYTAMFLPFAVGKKMDSVEWDKVQATS